jgi:hypothetical protein
MARKRVIDPNFFLKRDISKVSPLARLLYIGLWGICDDQNSTFPDDPDWIKIQILPYDDVKVDKLLKELSKLGKILKFTADDGKEYWYLKNFLKWQRIDRPSAVKYPRFKPTLAEHSTSTRPELKELIKLNKPENETLSSRESVGKKWGRNRR